MGSTLSTTRTEVRLVRIIEYVFADQETMDLHIAQLDTPLHGRKSLHGGKLMLSSTAMVATGDPGSLFTLQTEAPHEPSTKVAVFAGDRQAGNEFGVRHGFNHFTVYIPESDLGTLADHDVVVQTNAFLMLDPELYGPMRSTAYGHGLEVMTLDDWLERNPTHRSDLP